MQSLIYGILISICVNIFPKVAAASGFIVAFRLPGKSLRTLTPSAGESLIKGVLASAPGIQYWDWLGGETKEVGQPLGFGIVSFDSAQAGQAFLTEQVRAGRIVFFEEDGAYEFNGEEPAEEDSPENDSNQLWWHKDISWQLPENREPGAGLREGASGNPALIAILDSGIDVTHPALVGRIWQNPQPGSAGCMNDQWGCHTAIPHSERGLLGNGGANPFATVAYGKPCPTKTYGEYSRADGNCFHATHIAGIIAGNGDKGIWGICQSCQLINLKVVTDQGGAARVLDSSLLRGFKYLANLQKRYGLPLIIVNLSFGKRKLSRSFGIFLHALGRQGANFFIIAAAGNEGQHRPIYPAAESFVLGVSALAQGGKKASYSNFGTWVDLAAPGGDMAASEGMISSIASSIPGEGVEFSQGTSMAAPMVSGVAGLLMAQNPGLSSGILRKRLLDSAREDLYSEQVAGGYNRKYFYPRLRPSGKRVPLLGVGRLDASSALAGISNNQENPAFRERIKPVCGALVGGNKPQNHDNNWFFIVVLTILAPMVRCFAGRKSP